jgi:hypothetical protein
MIIHPGTRPLRLHRPHDSSAVVYYPFYLKPPAWEADTEYVEGHIVSPTTATGFYHKVTSSGVTGSTEPTWATTKNGETTDNTVTYKALNNESYLLANATLSTATITASDSVPVDDITYTSAGYIAAKVGPIPDGVQQFTLTVTFTADTGHTDPETDEYSVIVKVRDR